MKKQFLIYSQYCDPHTPKGLDSAIDGCLNYIAGTWLTTDFEIEALTVTNNPDGTTMATVVATRPALDKGE